MIRATPREVKPVLGVLSRSLGSFAAIPTIDIGSLVRNGDENAQQRVGDSLHKACTDVGFFYVENHGMPESLVTNAREHAREFFQQPEKVKKLISLSPRTNYRGYQCLGANVTRYDDSYQRDWHEAIDCYYEPSEPLLKQLSPSPIHGHNQWPQGTNPGLQPTMEQYASQMGAVGDAVMRGIALGLGLHPDFFKTANKSQDPYWCMRIIHYPPLSEASNQPLPVPPITSGVSPAPVDTANLALSGQEIHKSVQLSCGEHTDYGLLTLVNQDPEIAALQVKNGKGEWITAHPIKGTFVCNIGDMMRIWTNGMYRPTLHRVVNGDTAKSRISIPYFHEPAFDTVVSPILGLHGCGLSAQVPDKHYGAHLESKVFSNFEL